VHATYQAIDAIVGIPNTLLEFNVHAVTEGIDAIGEVTVRLMASNGSIPHRTSPQNGHIRARTFGGYGADTDILVASAKAYLAALNKLLVATGRHRPATRESKEPPA
jgi:2-isopropylmalate synthase